ncbi:13795_t:CDS:1 [Gigaspora margarita]|uniref:13795_t:CDS:1 n=1 Tax=Gigaspora margarita TaxID=4874 RepID=A0ABN7VAZ6_GIGMA|nr:13795_t:CDS:1 [Gigaspora margarita]
MDISHHPNDERLYNELNGHFFVITDPSVQEIIDGDYEFFVGSNNFILEKHCIHECIRHTFLWYLIWSTEDNDNLSIDKSNMVRHFRYFLVHCCMNDILERAYYMYVGSFNTKMDASFFLNHLKYIADLRYEDISQEYDNYINSIFR